MGKMPRERGISYLIFLSIWFHVCRISNTQELYHVVKVTDNSGYYLLYNKVARQIPESDKDTLISLHFEDKINNLTEISEAMLMKQYTIKQCVPLIKNDNPRNPDEAMKIYLMRHDLFNGNDLFGNFETIGNYTNPSITKFRGRMFMATALQLELGTGIGSHRRYATNTIEFRWVNCTKYPFYTNEGYLGVENEIAPLNMEFKGQDPRIVVYNDTYLQLYFSYVLNGLENQKMSIAELQYIESENRLNITYLTQPIHTPRHLFPNKKQKNWSPFIYRNETLLIQSLNPTFLVVKMSGFGTSHVEAEYYSQHVSSWNFHLSGDMRGGTNAILLPDHDVYLSFYHTSTKFKNNVVNTYVFGAYTFTAEPPFKMLSVSITPIMPREFYTKSWASRHIDYCVYPMHVFLDGADTLVVSFGYQDKIGMLGTINLAALLETLAPVENPTYY